MITKIYVKILNEDVIVWRPVEAKNINNCFFKIIDRRDFISQFDEVLEFVYGEIVECECKMETIMPLVKLKNRFWHKPVMNFWKIIQSLVLIVLVNNQYLHKYSNE